MKKILTITFLAFPLLTSLAAFSSESTQLKLSALIEDIGYLCGNDMPLDNTQKSSTIADAYSAQLKQKRLELQSHILVIDGWDLATTVEEVIFSNTTQSTTQITKLIYLLGAADPSYANPVLQRIYDHSESIATTRLQKDIQPEIRTEAHNSSTIDITNAVIDAIELSGTGALNEILRKEAASTRPASKRAQELLKKLESE